MENDTIETLRDDIANIKHKLTLLEGSSTDMMNRIVTVSSHQDQVGLSNQLVGYRARTDKADNRLAQLETKVHNIVNEFVHYVQDGHIRSLYEDVKDTGVTMQDIANALHMSQPTVSRVINDENKDQDSRLQVYKYLKQKQTARSNA